MMDMNLRRVVPVIVVLLALLPSHALALEKVEYQLEGAPLYGGQKQSLNFSFYNPGGEERKVVVDLSENASLIGAAHRFFAVLLPPGERETEFIDVRVPEDVQPQFLNYTVTELQYNETVGLKPVSHYEAAIEILPPLWPLEVQHRVTDKKIYPGESSNISFLLKNPSGMYRTVLIELSPPEGFEVPVERNTLLLPPQGEGRCLFEFYSNPQLLPGIHGVNYTVKDEVNWPTPYELLNTSVFRGRAQVGLEDPLTYLYGRVSFATLPERLLSSTEKAELVLAVENPTNYSHSVFIEFNETSPLEFSASAVSLRLEPGEFRSESVEVDLPENISAGSYWFRYNVLEKVYQDGEEIREKKRLGKYHAINVAELEEEWVEEEREVKARANQTIGERIEEAARSPGYALLLALIVLILFAIYTKLSGRDIGEEFSGEWGELRERGGNYFRKNPLGVLFLLGLFDGLLLVSDWIILSRDFMLLLFIQVVGAVYYLDLSSPDGKMRISSGHNWSKVLKKLFPQTAHRSRLIKIFLMAIILLSFLYLVLGIYAMSSEVGEEDTTDRVESSSMAMVLNSRKAVYHPGEGADFVIRITTKEPMERIDFSLAVNPAFLGLQVFGTKAYSDRGFEPGKTESFDFPRRYSPINKFPAITPPGVYELEFTALPEGKAGGSATTTISLAVMPNPYLFYLSLALAALCLGIYIHLFKGSRVVPLIIVGGVSGGVLYMVLKALLTYPVVLPLLLAALLYTYNQKISFEGISLTRASEYLSLGAEHISNFSIAQQFVFAAICLLFLTAITLSAGLETMANSVAILAYYSLVIGVFNSLWEYISKTEEKEAVYRVPLRVTLSLTAFVFLVHFSIAELGLLAHISTGLIIVSFLYMFSPEIQRETETQ